MKIAIVEFSKNYHNSYSSLKNLEGYILFTQNKNCNVVVEVKLSGLPIGIHGFHIHEKNIKQEYINDLKKGKLLKIYVIHLVVILTHLEHITGHIICN